MAGQAGSQRNLNLAALVACLTGALFGYSIGFIGGILVLPAFLRHFQLEELPAEKLASATSGTVTIWLVGALFGVLFGMPVCSRVGRKGCLIFAAGLYIVGAALQLGNVGCSLVQFDAGRLLNGLGVGAGSLVSPMYIAEISTPERRGMLLSGYQTAIQLAALAGFWAAFAAHATLPDSSALQWQIPVAIQLVPGVLLLLGIALIPESPRFLAEKARLPAAEDALAWLRGLPKEDAEVQGELEDMRTTAQALAKIQESKQSFWKDLQQKSVRKQLLVGIGLMIAQNMVGLNALNYYAPTIFMSAGYTSVSSSLFLTGLFGLTKVFSAIAFMFLFVGLKGNRFWLKLGSAICAISMLVLAFCIHHMSPSPAPGPDHPGSESTAGQLNPYGIVAVFMVYIFAFAFGISLGPLSWNICSEVFPAHIKARCCAITTCVQWIFQIVIAGITPHLIASIGWATYVVYAGFCVISLIWVQFYVPETQGVALGVAMDELFGASPKEAMQEEHVEALDETTALLNRANGPRTRRDSVGYV